MVAHGIAETGTQLEHHAAPGFKLERTEATRVLAFARNVANHHRLGVEQWFEFEQRVGATGHVRRVCQMQHEALGTGFHHRVEPALEFGTTGHPRLFDGT